MCVLKIAVGLFDNLMEVLDKPPFFYQLCQIIQLKKTENIK